MRWERTVLVSLAAAIALIVGIRAIPTERSDRGASQGVDAQTSESESSPVGSISSPAANGMAPLRQNDPESQFVADQNAESQKLNRLAVNRALESQKPTDLLTPSSQHLERESRQDVVKPFRASQSISKQCQSNPEPTRDSCQKVESLISDLNGEERDDKWAEAAESGIRTVVNGRPEHFSVRQVECRISLCAVEVVATFGTHFRLLQEQELELAGIEDEGNFVMGWEDDPMRGKLQITLRVFSRRVN